MSHELGSSALCCTARSFRDPSSLWCEVAWIVGIYCTPRGTTEDLSSPTDAQLLCFCSPLSTGQWSFKKAIFKKGAASPPFSSSSLPPTTTPTIDYTAAVCGHRTEDEKKELIITMEPHETTLRLSACLCNRDSRLRVPNAASNSMTGRQMSLWSWGSEYRIGVEQGNAVLSRGVPNGGARSVLLPLRTVADGVRSPRRYVTPSVCPFAGKRLVMGGLFASSYCPRLFEVLRSCHRLRRAPQKHVVSSPES